MWLLCSVIIYTLGTFKLLFRLAAGRSGFSPTEDRKTMAHFAPSVWDSAVGEAALYSIANSTVPMHDLDPDAGDVSVAAYQSLNERD